MYVTHNGPRIQQHEKEHSYRIYNFSDVALIFSSKQKKLKDIIDQINNQKKASKSVEKKLANVNQ